MGFEERRPWSFHDRLVTKVLPVKCLVEFPGFCGVLDRADSVDHLVEFTRFQQLISMQKGCLEK